MLTLGLQRIRLDQQGWPSCGHSPRHQAKFATLLVQKRLMSTFFVQLPQHVCRFVFVSRIPQLHANVSRKCYISQASERPPLISSTCPFLLFPISLRNPATLCHGFSARCRPLRLGLGHQWCDYGHLGEIYNNMFPRQVRANSKSTKSSDKASRFRKSAESWNKYVTAAEPGHDAQCTRTSAHAVCISREGTIRIAEPFAARLGLKGMGRRKSQKKLTKSSLHGTDGIVVE